MQLVRSGPAGSAALELAVSHALLTRVAAGELPSTLRVYRPAPAVAFGKLDTLRPGYANAVQRPARTATAGAQAPGRPRRRLPLRVAGDRRRLGARGPRRRHPRALRGRGRAAGGRAAHARRRRARGRGPRRVLPGRLQRQRRRAGEADRHRPAARPRRRPARRLDRRRRRPRHPRGPRRRLCRARVPLGRHHRRRRRRGGPGRTLDAVEAAVIAAYGELEPGTLDEATLALARRLTRNADPEARNRSRGRGRRARRSQGPRRPSLRSAAARRLRVYLDDRPAQRLGGKGSGLERT